MNLRLIPMSLLIGSVVAISCNQQNGRQEEAVTSTMQDSGTTEPVAIKEQPVTYSVDGKNFNGYVTYDSNRMGKRPAVLVVQEWWGLTDYPRNRAKQLAALGYIAMAVDMYGDGKTAADPKEAQALATPYYKDPTLAKTRLDAAIKTLKGFPQTDTFNIAAIGYCFGGFIVLNAVKLGANLKGIVSFHGDLGGVPLKMNLVKAKILICHGAADKFVTGEAVNAFKNSMDSAGIPFSYREYPNANHAFTNPAATELGKKFNLPIAYNAAADSASWNDMKTFFKKLF
ncbi:MAG: dienelactone hydrolase family protein [Ginsengibacter sp.]